MFKPRETSARSYERKPYTPREGGGDDRPRSSFDKLTSLHPEVLPALMRNVAVPRRRTD